MKINPMIINPTEYVKPCKTDGQCGNIRIAYLMRENPDYVTSKVDFSERIGRNVVTFVSDPESSDRFDPQNQVKFVCCNTCHMPINHKEALRLNDEIGFEAPSIKDTLAALKALKERLPRNEGRTC